MPSDVVDNAGSTARDHLANERTFLAWVRTALGLIGLGVILAKLVQTQGEMAEIAGLALVAFGAVFLLYSLVRYRRVATQLEQGKFPVSKRGPLWLGVGALVIAVGAFVFLLI